MSEKITQEGSLLSKSDQKFLYPYTKLWDTQVHSLLPSLPVEVKILWFADGPFLIEGDGVGGFASSKDSIMLVFQPGYKDKEKQLVMLKGVFFHEHFHVAHGYTGDNKALWAGKSMLAHAVYEGSATVFERERAGTNPFYGRYPDKKTVTTWLREIKSLPDNSDWRRWKIFHPDLKEANIAYRVGTFIVDEVLKNNPSLQIEDLITKDWREIFDLSGL